MEKREIRVNTSWEIKDKLQNELDNILVKDLEWENKIRLESKEDMKKRLGHSPDYADAIMMRMYWTLWRPYSPVTHTEVITINPFDDMLYLKNFLVAFWNFQNIIPVEFILHN